MERLRLSFFSAGIVALLAIARSLAAPSSVPPEPFILHGVTGDSVRHSRVNVQDLSAAKVATPLQEIPEEPAEPSPALALRPFHELPLPPGAVIHRESPAAPVEIDRERVLSPPPASNFAALGDDGRSTPPDTDGAVGPNHVVTMLNSQFRVQDRSGNALVTTTTEQFWASVTGGDLLTDPVVLYDPFADRWVAVIITRLSVANSSIFIGASQTGDPTGSWDLYRVFVDSTRGAAADFPRVGFNKDWIVVQVNMFGVMNSLFVRSQIYAFDKENLYAGAASARHTLFTLQNAGSTQVPALTYDNMLPAVYLLQEYGGDNNGKGFLRLWSVSGPLRAEVLTSISFPSTDATWAFVPPDGADFAPQQGGAAKIQLFTADFTGVVYRNGLITAAHTVFLPAAQSTRSAVQWWQLATNGTVIQRGRIDDPGGGLFYGFPSMAANRSNDLLVGYSTFSAQQFAGAGYSFRAAADPPGTLRDGQVLKPGEAYYLRLNRGVNRWGDYSATTIDPSNDADFWTIQEYAATPSSQSLWGTWWGRVVPDSGPLVPLPAAGFEVSGAAIGEPAAFTDRSTNATRFFWNFGDGTSSTEENPVHTFATEGAYVVTLIAVNQTGASTVEHTVRVTRSRALPVPLSQPQRSTRGLPPRG